MEHVRKEVDESSKVFNEQLAALLTVQQEQAKSIEAYHAQSVQLQQQQQQQQSENALHRNEKPSIGANEENFQNAQAESTRRRSFREEQSQQNQRQYSGAQRVGSVSQEPGGPNPPLQQEESYHDDEMRGEHWGRGRGASLQQGEMPQSKYHTDPLRSSFAGVQRGAAAVALSVQVAGGGGAGGAALRSSYPGTGMDAGTWANNNTNREPATISQQPLERGEEGNKTDMETWLRSRLREMFTDEMQGDAPSSHARTSQQMQKQKHQYHQHYPHHDEPQQSRGGVRTLPLRNHNEESVRHSCDPRYTTSGNEEAFGEEKRDFHADANQANLGGDRDTDNIAVYTSSSSSRRYTDEDEDGRGTDTGRDRDRGRKVIIPRANASDDDEDARGQSQTHTASRIARGSGAVQEVSQGRGWDDDEYAWKSTDLQKCRYDRQSQDAEYDQSQNGYGRSMGRPSAAVQSGKRIGIPRAVKEEDEDSADNDSIVADRAPPYSKDRRGGNQCRDRKEPPTKTKPLKKAVPSSSVHRRSTNANHDGYDDDDDDDESDVNHVDELASEPSAPPSPSTSSSPPTSPSVSSKAAAAASSASYLSISSPEEEPASTHHHCRQSTPARRKEKKTAAAGDTSRPQAVGSGAISTAVSKTKSSSANSMAAAASASEGKGVKKVREKDVVRSPSKRTKHKAQPQAEEAEEEEEEGKSDGRKQIVSYDGKPDEAADSTAANHHGGRRGRERERESNKEKESQSPSQEPTTRTKSPPHRSVNKAKAKSKVAKGEEGKAVGEVLSQFLEMYRSDQKEIQAK
jgi:hypothetical protein